MDVWVKGKKVRVSPRNLLGQGGEAEVYDVGKGRALKLFKRPDHPDFAQSASLAHAARERVTLHQSKLPAFPRRLPDRVVGPEELAHDRSGARILGYTMRLVPGAESLARLADPGWRRAGGASAAEVRDVFLALHDAAVALHRAGVVIGDFNDTNVLVTGAGPWLIDADSFQYGGFPCAVFTERFVDPRLCDPAASSPRLVRPHDELGDWYSFAALMMQSFLCVGPFGGVHRPRDPAARLPHGRRPLEGITVFHPEVVYPRPAFPREVLPDEVLAEFERTFAEGVRVPFPRRMIERLEFARCAACGLEHARLACPRCLPGGARVARPVVAVHGGVTARRLGDRDEVVVAVFADGGTPAWVAHDGRGYLREDGTRVLEGPLDPRLRFSVRGKETWVAGRGDLRVVAGGADLRRLALDPGRGPVAGANHRHAVWIEGGRLQADAGARTPGPVVLGEVLENQTRLWLGPTFGVGLTRAGGYRMLLVFDPGRRGIREVPDLPPLPGELVQVEAALSAERAWVFLGLESRGRRRHLALVFDARGRLVGTAEGEAGDGSWLGVLGGAAAHGPALFVPTDGGMVRVEVAGGVAAPVRSFPDTAAFVDAASLLAVTREGILAATAGHLDLLSMGPPPPNRKDRS